MGQLVYRAMQADLDLQDHLVTQADQDHLERPVTLARADQLEALVHLVYQVLQVLWDQQVLPEYQARPVELDRSVRPAQLDQQGLKESVEPQDHKAVLVFRVLKVRLAFLDHPDRWDQAALLVHQDQLGALAQQDQAAVWDPWDLLVLQDLMVGPDLLDHQEFQEQLADPVLKESTVFPECQVPADLPGLADLQV